MRALTVKDENSHKNGHAAGVTADCCGRDEQSIMQRAYHISLVATPKSVMLRH